MSKLGWDVKVNYEHSEQYDMAGVTVAYNIAADDYSVSFNSGELIRLFRSGHLDFIRPHLEKDRVILLVCEIFNDQFDRPVGENTTLKELNADSLDVVELAMQMEEEFDLTTIINDHDIGKWKKVGDVCATVQKAIDVEGSKSCS